MTLPVTLMLPPIDVLLIVNRPICASQAAAADEVPKMVMLFAVIPAYVLV